MARLVVYSSQQQMSESLIGAWLGGEKRLFHECMPTLNSNIAYDEIIVMPMFDPPNDWLKRHFGLADQQAVKEVINFFLENLPGMLAPGGRLINLNDPEIQFSQVCEDYINGKVEPNSSDREGDQVGDLQRPDPTPQSDPEA